MFSFIGLSIIVVIGFVFFGVIISSKKIPDEKREKLFIVNLFISAAAILLFVLLQGHIQYYLREDKRTTIATPSHLVFYSHFNNISEAETIYDGNSETCWFDYDTQIYHLKINRENFESDDRVAYFTGDYRNYPHTPDVFVNGEYINATSENDGDTGGWVDIDRLYHFELDCPVEPNKIYKITVNCGTVSETIKLMFHESEESIPGYLKNNLVCYTLDGDVYHRYKDCRYLENAEKILTGTIKYCGKDRACKNCY